MHELSLDNDCSIAYVSKRYNQVLNIDVLSTILESALHVVCP